MTTRIPAIISLLPLLLGACGGVPEDVLDPSAPVASRLQAVAPTLCSMTQYPDDPCCGDGNLDANEDCEGTNLGRKTCLTLGFTGGTLACNSVCKFDTSGCSTCGDGQITGAEECEPGNLGGKTCLSLGFTGGTLSCNSKCRLVKTGCTGGCGNGVVENGEYCDGAALGGKTCGHYGFDEGTLGCTASCLPDTSGCELGWDFEDGTLQGWSILSTPGTQAFTDQPTYGENVSATRTTSLASDIGGDYWQVAYPIGIEGDYWIGTYERRPTASVAWGTVRGTGATGELVSPAFRHGPRYIHFLVGGCCNATVAGIALEQRTGLTTWTTVAGSARAAPSCGETLQRVVLDTAALSLTPGALVRLRLYDRLILTSSKLPFGKKLAGHLNIDDIHVSDTRPAAGADRQPVWGLADTHAHPAANLAYGGRVIWGKTSDVLADGTVQETGTCQGGVHRVSDSHQMSASHLLYQLEDQHLFSRTAEDLPPPVHAEHGVTSSSWHSLTHQQMYERWIHRSYKAGLRLLVAEAVNNRGLDWLTWKSPANQGAQQTDMESAEAQLVALQDMIARNKSWMAQARKPSEARAIIRGGKLAVVLGVEVDAFANCDRKTITTLASSGHYYAGTDGCTTADIDYWLARMFSKYGVRQVHPVHLTDNGFGGAAIYNDLFNTVNHFINAEFFSLVPFWISTDIGWTIDGNYQQASTTTFPGVGEVKTPGPSTIHFSLVARNNRDLTSNAAHLVSEMKKRGMIIAADHMSERSLDELIGLNGYAGLVADPACKELDTKGCQEQAYPVALTHTAPRQRQYLAKEIVKTDEPGACKSSGFEDKRYAKGKIRSEIAKNDDQLERIYAIGGIVSPGITAGDVRHLNSYDVTNVANTCAGSSRSFAQLYKHLHGMGGKGQGVPFATDFGGLNGSVVPRYGEYGCWARNDHFATMDGTCRTSYPSNISSSYSYRTIDGANDYEQREKQLSTTGVNYDFYAGETSIPHTAHLAKAHTTTTGRSMTPATSQPALKPATLQGRTWDINFDGVAHYGMLPDFFQDLRAVGMTRQDLEPLFRGAEAYIRMWEKACSFSSSTVGCD
jgi:microsomal dipeptidase-like Zn-dependent dipeptidase